MGQARPVELRGAIIPRRVQQRNGLMNGSSHIMTAVQEIVKRVVAEYAPQKIILFGSYAYGQPNEDSDIDLLIIKETPERSLQRMDTVRRAAMGAHQRIPFEPLVLTPEEVEQRLRAGDQFIAEILHKGEVLYGGDQSDGHAS